MGGNEDESLGERVAVRDEAADNELLSVVLGLTSCDSSEPEDDGLELDSVPRNDVALVEEELPMIIVLGLVPTASVDEELDCEEPVASTVDSVVLAKVIFGKGPPPVPDGRM